MENIIESKRYIPCITDEEANLKVKDSKFIFICQLPENFNRVVNCETDKKDRLSYIVKKDCIEVTNNNLEPFSLHYEVSKSRMIESLIEEINSKLNSL